MANVGWNSSGTFPRRYSSARRLTASVDHLVYDSLLRLRSQPVLPDIAVVEIDNASIARLGRWPWPRDVHAKLLEEIAKAHPAAIVYDVLFTEPWSTSSGLFSRS